MKTKLLLITCLLTVVATVAFKVQSNVAQQIVKHHFEALNSHNLDELTKDYASDAKIRSASWDGNNIGPSAIKDAYTRYFHTSPDLKYTITDVICSDTSAVI